MKRALLACIVLMAAVVAVRGGTNQYVSINGTAISPYTNWAQAATNLSQVLAATADGNTIIISNGVYWPTSAITTIVKSIIITSLYGAAQTIFNGGGSNFAGLAISVVTNVTVYGLTITNFFGSGINVWGATPLKLDSCILTGNKASQGGGIFCNAASLIVTNCIIKGNTATAASGNYGGGGIIIYNPGTWRVDNSVISYNIATNFTVAGGGIDVVGVGVMTIQNCTIANNTSGGNSGGVMLSGVGSRMANSFIISNACLGSGNGNYGGGVYINSGSFMDNCLVAYNSNALSRGGGVWLSGTMRNCTVVSNDAPYQCGGVGGIGTSINSIVYFNNSPYYKNWFIEQGDAGLSGYFTNCCTMPNPGGYTKGGLPQGVNCITNDPNMANMAADCHLLKGSLCINRGLNDFIWMNTAVDLDGRPRIRQGTVDIGAYEYFPKGVVLMLQ